MRASGRLAWPYLAGLTLLVFLPAAGGILLAFTEFSGISAPRFNGLDNIRRLLADEGVRRALGNSIAYAAISVPLRLVAAVGLALLLHRRGPGIAGARAAVFLPTVVPDAAYGLLWLWLLDPVFGPLPLLARSAGMSGDWITQPWGARTSVAVMGGFQIGEAFVIALAARRLIPSNLYETAAVENARPWFVLRRVTLPLMAPALILLALRDIVLSFQVSFVPALVVTEGGPRLATTFLPLYVYRAGFRYLRLGYAASITLTMFLVSLLVVYLAYRLARRWRYL